MPLGQEATIGVESYKVLHSRRIQPCQKIINEGGVANTLAYYDMATITSIISFIGEAIGAWSIKLITAVIVAVL